MLHPAALWTLAALALPLAIHLRRPPPRTVRLGSLRFLENIPRRPWRQPRWRELVLLWLRLGLLAVLSLLLAGPRWTAPAPLSLRSWALLDPAASLTGETLERWRSLRALGYETHWLAPGFPTVSGVPSGSRDAPAPDLWSLLREADGVLPTGSTLAVFWSGRLTTLRGVRPHLARCRLYWIPAPDPDKDHAHTWTVNTPSAVIQGRSDAQTTTFTTAPAQTTATVRAVSVLILYDDAHATDARYVEAAVRAAADSMARPVNVQARAITADVDNAAATDWTFWLSTDPVPDALASRAPRIVRYAPGSGVAVDGFIVAPGEGVADSVALRQRTVPAATPAPAATTFWSDGQGNPLLTYSHPSAARETWELWTRFDPAWNDLPRSGALAAWVRARLFPEATASDLPADPVNDRRIAAPSQGDPGRLNATTIQTLAPIDQPTFDPHWVLWTLAALLFAAERTLSLRRAIR